MSDGTIQSNPKKPQAISYKIVIPLLILVASLSGLLLILKTPFAGIVYRNVLAHSFVLLACTVTLFFVCFFSYQRYVRDRDIRWYVLSVAFFVGGVFALVHAVSVPEFSWGNDTFFDISEHYGFFLTSLLLWGLLFPFSTHAQEYIYRARTKIFVGLNVFLAAVIVSIFFIPSLSRALDYLGNFFIILTAVNSLFLMIVLLTRKEDTFFTTSLPKVLSLFVAVAISSFFEHEWDGTFWYFHLLWLSALLLLLLLRASDGAKKKIAEIPFASFSIRMRLLCIVGCILLTVSINGLIDFNLSQNHLKTQTLENLVLVADLQEGQVLNWLDTIKQRTADFASDGFIREYTAKIIAGDREATSILMAHLVQNKMPLDSAVYGLHIMNLEGTVIASNQQSEIGMSDMAQEDVFLQAKGAQYGKAAVSDMFRDTHFGEKNDAILVTAPITDKITQKTVGVLMLFIRTNGLSDILTGKNQTELGALSTWTARKKTMEVILINHDSIMISESKFVVNAILNKKVDTEPVRKCRSSEEISGEWLDYRQIPVFGASMCFANGWTLVAIIDTDEVLGSLGDYLQQNLLSGSATGILIFFLLYLFMISVVTPLKELSSAAKKIGKGDSGARVSLITKDEFGQLGLTFNEMADLIQKFQLDVHRKLQTEETNRQAMGNILDDLAVAKSQLESEKAQDEAILASIGDAVLACDKNGKVILFNGVAEGLTGFSAKEIVGKHYSKALALIKESDGNPSNNFIGEAIRTGKGTKMENHTLLITKDGRKIPVADSAAPIKDVRGEIIGCVVVFRDVTHEHAVDKAKTEFVSVASHQLRTPLGIIKWYLEALRVEKTYSALPDRQKEYVETAYTNTTRLIELVRDMLDVSRIEKGTAINEVVSVDPLTLLQEVIKEMDVEVRKRNITVTLKAKEKSQVLMFDKKRLHEVYSNLLSNAIKYNKEKGTVSIMFTIKQGVIVVSFKDTGIGIPEKDKASLFGKFFRAGNAVSSNTDGSGMGLYVVKSYVEQWGGTITFESAMGKGSTFTITIPLTHKQIPPTV